jgi:hypothetical protein
MRVKKPVENSTGNITIPICTYAFLRYLLRLRTLTLYSPGGHFKTKISINTWAVYLLRQYRQALQSYCCRLLIFFVTTTNDDTCNTYTVNHKPYPINRNGAALDYMRMRW